MSDLISRLSLKDRASEYALSADEYKRLCKIIDTEPTAYSVDNVVEEFVECICPKCKFSFTFSDGGLLNN